MVWKEQFSKKTNLPYYQEVYDKKTVTKPKDDWAKTSCNICQRDVKNGEEYFIYWVKMKDLQRIGKYGKAVCLNCDKELEIM